MAPARLQHDYVITRRRVEQLGPARHMKSRNQNRSKHRIVSPRYLLLLPFFPPLLAREHHLLCPRIPSPTPRHTRASLFSPHLFLTTLLQLFIMSYADVAAKGPKQSPEEAAAPQPPQVIPNESASTASLVDVDMPSVHTVSSEFLEQDVQTETQAERRDREAAAAEAKRQKREEEARQSKKEAAKAKARRADNWLANQFSQLSDGSASALVIANLAAVVGLSSYLGYRAWGLYDKGRLTWGNVGVGAGILAGVGVFEAAFGNYLYKGKKDN